MCFLIIKNAQQPQAEVADGVVKQPDFFAPLPGGGAAIAVGCGAFHSAASSAHGVFGCGEGYGDSKGSCSSSW